MTTWSPAAVSMSSTTRSRPWWGSVIVVEPLPNWIDVGEPGGVNCHAADAGERLEVDVETPAEAQVEGLGTVNVGDREGRDLELLGGGGGSDLVSELPWWSWLALHWLGGGGCGCEQNCSPCAGRGR